ncbi:meiotic recombination protein REC114-like isoform X2 [Denticeps clupeoides]|uniref:meiotic recombination protein REC114-like isoform X1 n=1 Tax=Denticeps clupeoides TaxID=299321 RepID=UPI0010A5512A|nr:meiotic recombination protein REC114-like isoform X1 [Denticeps clupeoides]XP_028813016.1 meiotic recombination protein REC114-like isoform X2 [Denticeps clupeoides]
MTEGHGERGGNTTPVWKLRRYGRLVPRSQSWKVFESGESAGQVVLSVLDSGHFLLSQAQELLEGFSLINASNFIKAQRISDILLFRVTLKGESRLFRVQFDGSSRAEAVEQCSSAVLRLQEYLPVGSQPSSAAPIQLSTAPKQDAPLAASPPQHLLPVPGASARPDPELAQGTLSLRCLAQHFLGEGDLSLPMAYHHLALPHGDLEPFLRLCLFDPSFPAFVEEVEGELKKLANE